MWFGIPVISLDVHFKITHRLLTGYRNRLRHCKAFATITASTKNGHRIGAAQDDMHGYHGRILHMNLTNGEDRKNKATFT